MYKEINYTGFEERKNKLKSIKRYNHNEPMFYRTHLGMHARRVCWLVEELLQIAKQEDSQLDPEKARALALVHDDTEIITGDVISPDKKAMSLEQKQALQKREEEAIQFLAKTFPKEFHSYNYEELLREAQAKESKEAQLVNIADKFDAFGEALHEVFAGNTNFNKPQREGYNAPVEYYFQELKKIIQTTTFLSHLATKTNLPILKAPPVFDIKKKAEEGKRHSLRSIAQETGYEHYDYWKKVTIERGNLKGIRYLVEQKESKIMTKM